MKANQSSSIGIRKAFGDMKMTKIAEVGHGDAKLTLWRAEDGRHVIETNGDPVFDHDRGFADFAAETFTQTTNQKTI